MSRSHYILDENFKKLYEEEISVGCPPTCKECGQQLDIGDQIDGHWPYFRDNNLCQKCKIGDAKGKRKLKWEEEMKQAKPTDNKIEMHFAEECVLNLRTYMKWFEKVKDEDKDGINGYARGYYSGLLRVAQSIIAMSPISKQAWQAAGLTFKEYEMCKAEIIG